MPLTQLAVGGYRSLQELVLPLGSLTLVSGANGSGKSNLHRALRLIVAAARGDLVGSLAREGGLPAALWAGPDTTRRGRPVRLRLGFAGDTLSYAIELGYPAEPASAFSRDPLIKEEWIWAGGSFHPRALLAQRQGVDSVDSLLAGGTDPGAHPEVELLRRQILSWRFYDGFRCDPAAPARHPGVATRTMALADDGGDLPAALQTILEIGDGDGLQAAIDDAFPGCSVAVDISSPCFQVQLRQPGLLRALDASELSDGTLRYLLLAVALFSPRLPPLLVLNEPESSLHPELLAPLARLIMGAASRTQVWVIAHAPALIAALEAQPECRHLHLERQEGATRLPGQTTLEKAAWRWPG